MTEPQSVNQNKFEQYQQQEKEYAREFKNAYDLQNYIEHPDSNVAGGGEQYIIDKGNWECRFCKKTKEDGATFKKKAHVLPEQVGNKLIVSHSECDDCNKLFSEHETHLSEFLGPLKTLLGVKGKSRKGKRIPTFKDPSKGTRITHSGEEILWKLDPNKTIVRLDSTTEISVGVKHRPFIPISVWKGLARTAVHLFDLNELNQFTWFTECVSTEEHDNLLNASKGLCTIFSIFIPSAYNVYPRPELRLFNRKKSGVFEVEQMIIPEKMYVVCSSSHIYQIPVFSDNDYEELRESGTATENRSIPFYPLNIDEQFVENFDLPKRSVHYLNSLTQEAPVNWVQFSYKDILPMTDEKLRKAGLTEDEITQLKSNGINGPEILKKFGDFFNDNKSAT